MAYTARLTKQQLRQRRDASRDRSRDNTKGTAQYLVTYAYTNNNCLLCASNIIVSVAIPTILQLKKRIKGLEIAICHNACRTERQSINVDVCMQFIKKEGSN